jgi:hypothetical protein
LCPQDDDFGYCIAQNRSGEALAYTDFMAENGATVAQPEAIYGWTGRKMASLYWRARPWGSWGGEKHERLSPHLMGDMATRQN